MHDIVIRGGTIVDGTGAPRFTGDVAIDGERIAQVGGKAGPAKREIDADGLLVTPGWVDVHTHYDGQATWDPLLAPSSWHGVTTMLFGNCGVGFAPARPEHRGALMDLMEGVEEIPGAALAEGLEMELGELPRIPRRAGAHAARDRRRGADPAPPAARLCDGRPRDRLERRRPPTTSRRCAGSPSRRCGPARSASPPRAPIRTRRPTRRDGAGALFRSAGAARHRLARLGELGDGAFGMNSDFDDEVAEVAWMTRARQGDRPPGVVPADRPLQRSGALAPADRRGARGARRRARM